MKNKNTTHLWAFKDKKFNQFILTDFKKNQIYTLIFKTRSEARKYKKSLFDAGNYSIVKLAEAKR